MAVAAFVATLGRSSNPDTLWHLAIGRWIVTHRAIPDIGGFYYSGGAGFGYDYSWLAQTFLFVAYQLLGGAGVAVLSALVASLTFYFLYRLLEQNSVNMLVNFAVLCLALATITPYLSGRPMMFTVAFFTIEVFILSVWTSARGENAAGKRSRGILWLIPPMMVAWANLHPGFGVAPLLILLFMPMVSRARDRWNMAACLAATAAAVLINPYGWRLLLMPFATAGQMSMLRGLSEWAGVSGLEAVLWGGLVALVTCGLSLRRQPFTVTLLVAGTGLAAGLSNRNMPLFGVVAVLVLGRTLLPVLEPALKRIELVRKFDVKFADAGGGIWTILVPLLLSGAVRLHISPMDLDFDFSSYPRAAVRYIEDNGCPDNLFVRETWSGYLLWEMPDRKLFYDAKGGFSREATRAHSELVKPKPDWRKVVDRYDLSTILLESGTPLAVLLNEAPDWRRVYSDSLSDVFVRTSPGQRQSAIPPGAKLP